MQYVTVVRSSIADGKMATALQTLKLKSKRKEVTDKPLSQKDKDGYTVLLCGAERYIEATETTLTADEIVHIVAGVISEIRNAAEEGKIESDSKLWLPHEKGGKRPQTTEEISGDSDKTGQEVVELAPAPTPDVTRSDKGKKAKKIGLTPVTPATPAQSSSDKGEVDLDTTDSRRAEIEALMSELDMDVSALPVNKKDCLKLGSKQIADLGKLCNERIPDFLESFVMVDGELKHGKRGTPVRNDWTDGIYRYLKT
ncbi:hypothetical protein CVIRNUC_003533 [Coccomyxa viridis]|uniref:Uncharacterized protein n=1 Tax=Coccomyxa viridis TaxID=1274662 RepID=A0AAV1I3B5_9CHLO|nr:hypothetical protein CVIRNUC_003533 [Coccomyxa viridis]